jgi:hypothetical protein
MGGVPKPYPILEQYFEVHGIAVLLSPLKEHFPWSESVIVLEVQHTLHTRIPILKVVQCDGEKR